MTKVVTFGEIMLRLSPPGFLRFSQTNSFDIIYGGGESNVAVSLANYGVPVRFVTRIPENDIGQSAKMEMRKRGVETEFMIYGGDRLGIYFLESSLFHLGLFSFFNFVMFYLFSFLLFGCNHFWSGRKDLNLRPPQPHCGALPSCATPRRYQKIII